MIGTHLNLLALLLVFVSWIPAIRGQQECPGTQELQNSLRQAHKLLSAHEASYLQSLRTLRKKLSLLQNSAARLPAKANNGPFTPFQQFCNDMQLAHLCVCCTECQTQKCCWDF